MKFMLIHVGAPQ